jgi:hypothetical protein
MITRRKFALAPGLLGATLSLPGCGQPSGAESYKAVAAQTWRQGPLRGLEGAALSRELVRYATLAPSSHNTQCWQFKVAADTITILPDWSRRCPAVDPDDHHLFVSLGCATENLAQAALAHGLRAQARFDTVTDAVHIALEPVAAQSTATFAAIASRQCTRGDYDGVPLSATDLKLLEAAGTAQGVRMVVLTERSAMERVLEQVLAANTAQMADRAFVQELKAWIRFNEAQALRTRDGLFSAASGSPTLPGWLGDLAFGWFFTPQGENEKYARQIRSSSGLAVFVGAVSDKAHWVEVGRCYQRFALQATALGIRNAMLNQPVEVAASRPAFAAVLGLPDQRPDLVVRFGRGTAMPQSLRRSVDAVLV